jgi:hypothetical protein
MTARYGDAVTAIFQDVGRARLIGLKTRLLTAWLARDHAAPAQKGVRGNLLTHALAR